METAFLVPQKGMIVRDPVTKAIMLETGETKPLTGAEGRYWRRRIGDGSVTILETKPAKRKTKEE